jgi:hypothetical protein
MNDAEEGAELAGGNKEFGESGGTWEWWSIIESFSDRLEELEGWLFVSAISGLTVIVSGSETRCG